MKRLIYSALVCLIPITAFGQNWTPEQQEVIDHIKTCWDGWVDAKEQNDISPWVDVCPGDESAASWFTDSGAPRVGRSYSERGMSSQVQLWGDGQWLDLRLGFGSRRGCNGAFDRSGFLLFGRPRIRSPGLGI